MLYSTPAFPAARPRLAILVWALALCAATGTPAAGTPAAGTPAAATPAAGTPAAGEDGEPSDPHRRRAEDLLRELVGYRTSAAFPAETEKAVEAMAARLLAAGFAAGDVQVVRPEPPRVGLVARYRGTGGRRPLLLLAHIDVVGAEPAAWSFDPFTFAERGGYYYGRGSSDNKAGVATLVANFIRLRAEGFAARRDLIMVLTGDEETEGKVISWLLNVRRQLVDAELALNTDAGGGVYDPAGRPQMFVVQTSEKVYQTYRLTVTDPGGHSSLPRPDNAIYRLAAALGRLAGHRFAVSLDAGTRLYFERAARFQDPATARDMRAVAAAEPDLEAAERLSASPYLNAILRTTCVATELAGGHAENALPRSASATVNCRVLPGTAMAEVEAELARVIADDAVAIESTWDGLASEASELTPEMLALLEELVEEQWPGTPVVPEMSTGATDGLFVRNAGIPVLGVSAIFERPDDVRAHGLDERIGVSEYHAAVEFWYCMLKRLGG